MAIFNNSDNEFSLSNDMQDDAQLNSGNTWLHFLDSNMAQKGIPALKLKPRPKDVQVSNKQKRGIRYGI